MAAINENTKVTVGLVVALVGGVWWLTDLYSAVQTQAAEIKNLKNEARFNQEYNLFELRAINKKLDEIRDRLKPSR